MRKLQKFLLSFSISFFSVSLIYALQKSSIEWIGIIVQLLSFVIYLPGFILILFPPLIFIMGEILYDIFIILIWTPILYFLLGVFDTKEEKTQPEQAQDEKSKKISRTKKIVLFLIFSIVLSILLPSLVALLFPPIGSIPPIRKAISFLLWLVIVIPGLLIVKDSGDKKWNLIKASLSILLIVPVILFFVKISIDSYNNDPDRLTNLAVENNDTSFCDRVPEQRFMGGVDRGECYHRVARINKNLSTCEDGRYGGDSCFSVLALSSKDPKICENVIDTDRRDDCFFDIVRDYSDLNINICDNIIKTLKKIQCYENYYRSFFVSREDVFICNSIGNEELKNACLFGYVKAEKSDLAFCKNSFLSNFNYQNLCFFMLAIREKNENYCNFIQDNRKDECLSYIARSKEDVKICAMIEETTLADQCIKDIATVAENLSLCYTILDNKIKDGCISTIGQRKLDKNICNLVQIKEEKNKCLEFIKRNK